MCFKVASVCMHAYVCVFVYTRNIYTGTKDSCNTPLLKYTKKEYSNPRL